MTGRDKLEPWLTGIRVNWEPELRYYEHRLEALRLLEDQQKLVSFNVGAEEITAQIGSGLECSVTAESFYVRSGYATPPQDLSDLVRMLVETIQPRVVTSLIVDFQHIVPLDASYDEARRMAGAHLLPDQLPHQLVDFAVLIDARMPADQGTYQVEYGVIAASEVASRLMRRTGRMGGKAGRRPTLPAIPTPLPAVALFADSIWNAGGRAPAADLADAVGAFLATASLEAQRLISFLYQRVVAYSGSQKGE